MTLVFCFVVFLFLFSSRRRHTRCALVTGVQTCALPISCHASQPRHTPAQQAPMAPQCLLKRHRRGEAVPNYNEVQSAARVEKFKIWFAWASGGIIMAIITNATKNVSVVSVITEVAFFVLGILATIAAFRMTNALNRRADTARKEVLGDL